MGLLLVALEECSQSLVVCLERQDPSYLEHLQRRGELIRRLAGCPPPALRKEALERFKRCRTLGDRAQGLAGRMREGASRDLAAAGQERLVADGLRSLVGIQRAMLDVKA